jgi:hypothetical protein
MNVVFNIFDIILSSSGGVFIEGLFILGSHGSGVGRCSIGFTAVFSSNSLTSSSDSSFKRGSVRIWSWCIFLIISLSKAVMMVMVMSVSIS